MTGSRNPGRAVEGAAAPSRRLGVLRLCAVGACLLTVVLMYPGFLAHDSVVQLRQARAGSSPTDWHPPLMALIWSVTDSIVSGPIGMLLLQLAILWTGIYLVVSSLAGLSLRVCVSLLFGSVFFPPVLVVLGVVWKDALVAAFLMLGFGLVARWPVDAKARARPTALAVVSAAGILLVFLVATALRHNAIGAVIGGVWFFAFKALVPKGSVPRRLARSLPVALVIAVLMQIAAMEFNEFSSRRPARMWQLGLMHDLVGISILTGDSVFDDPAVKSRLGGMLAAEDLSAQTLARVAPEGSVPILKLYRTGQPEQCFRYRVDPGEFAALRRLWWETVTHSPGAYLAHRWNLIRELIRLRQIAWGPVYMRVVPAEDEDQKQALQHDYRLSALQEWLRGALRRVQYSAPFRPFYYLAATMLILLSSVPLLRRGLELPVFMSFSGFLFELTYFLAATAPEYRYSHWMILCAWTSVLILTARPGRAISTRGERFPASAKEFPGQAPSDRGAPGRS